MLKVDSLSKIDFLKAIFKFQIFIWAFFLFIFLNNSIHFSFFFLSL